MSTYNTGNPLGSAKPEDLFDNSQNIDKAANDLEAVTWPDRFGRDRVTLSEYERRAQGVIDGVQQQLADTTARKYYDTRALRDADTMQPVGMRAFVDRDPVLANNGQSAWDGSVWTPTVLQPADSNKLNVVSNNASLTSLFLGTGDLSKITSSAGAVDRAYTSAANNTTGYGPPTASIGARLSKVKALYNSGASGNADILVLSSDKKLLAKYRVAVGSGLNVWAADSGHFPETYVPIGGHVFVRRFDGSGMRFWGSATGIQTLSTSGFTNAENIGDLQDFAAVADLDVAIAIEYESASRTLADLYPKRESIQGAIDRAILTSAFLGASDVVWQTRLFGSAQILPSSILNDRGYGPADVSPGGFLTAVRAYYDSAATGSAYIDVIDKNKIFVSRFVVPVSGGLKAWTAAAGDFPEIYVEKGSVVLLRRAPNAAFGYKQQTVSDGTGNAFTTGLFAQAVNIGDTQEYSLSTTLKVAVEIQYRAISRTLDDLLGDQDVESNVIPLALIDEKFKTITDWSLLGATIHNGLVSAASSSWASRCYPVNYGFSELDRRTRTAVATISAANQIWGISWIREPVGTQLNTPAMIVDGVSNSLKVYEFDSNVTIAPELRLEAIIPWTVTGSRVRLTENRIRFATTYRLDNMVTGQSVQLVKDYAAESGASGWRPCGRPIVIFPSTVEGGVKVEHFRMVADYPYPAGKAASTMYLGDSNTESSQIGTDFDKGWAYLLQAMRAAKGSDDSVVIAKGGQRSEHLANCIPEMLHLCDDKTRVVIVIGTNDANQGTTRAATRANIQRIVDALRTKTKLISVACLPPLGDTPSAARALLVEDAINMYWGADLLPPVRFDLALSLNNDGFTRNPALYKENTHPNVAGNAVMAQRALLDLPSLAE